jgi:site-specific DNA recombinase
VRLVSITQELGDDPAQVMMRQIIGLFDEYQSRENGKHVRKALIENARQGFCNGSPIPLGYKSIEVEIRGARIKKKLAIDAVEAETVKLIFRLYRQGDGTFGLLGVKKLTSWLNERGYRTRRGARFGVATVHGILSNSIYMGQWVFNKRDLRTLKQKPANEHVTVEVPVIIPSAEFEAVAVALKARDPRVTSPRVVTGPILLTGIATCATCNGASERSAPCSRSCPAAQRSSRCNICASCRSVMAAAHLLNSLVRNIEIRRGAFGLPIPAKIPAKRTAAVGFCLNFQCVATIVPEIRNRTSGLSYCYHYNFFRGARGR